MTNEKGEELAKAIAALQAEVMSEIDEIKAKLANVSTKRAPSTKAPSDTSALKSNKISNCMYYYKRDHYADRVAAMKKYFTDDQIKKFEKHFNSDESIKGKVGNARLEAEYKYIWNNYVKPKEYESTKKLIKADFDNYQQKIDKDTITPAKKDEKSPAKETKEKEKKEKKTTKKPAKETKEKTKKAKKEESSGSESESEKEHSDSD